MAAAALLTKNPRPSAADIDRGMRRKEFYLNLNYSKKYRIFSPFAWEDR